MARGRGVLLLHISGKTNLLQAKDQSVSLFVPVWIRLLDRQKIDENRILQQKWDGWGISKRQRKKKGRHQIVVNPLKGTLKAQRNGRRYGDWYTGRWWVGCYIWYSEEGPGRAAAPPSLLLAVPNVAHPSTASVPTLYYLMWHCNCLWTLKG